MDERIYAINNQRKNKSQKTYVKECAKPNQHPHTTPEETRRGSSRYLSTSPKLLLFIRAIPTATASLRVASLRLLLFLGAVPSAAAPFRDVVVCILLGTIATTATSFGDSVAGIFFRAVASTTAPLLQGVAVIEAVHRTGSILDHVRVLSKVWDIVIEKHSVDVVCRTTIRETG